MPHDHQTEAMLEAERRAGIELGSKEALEVRLGVLRSALVRQRDAALALARDIDVILGERGSDG